MVITISPWQSYLQRSAASALSVIAVSLILPHRASAADWTFVPTLRLRESYSDNIELASPALATSDLVSEITPGINVTANSSHLKLNMSYSLQQLIYQHEPDALNHQLQGNAKAELLDDWLFVDASASISKQNVSAFGPQLIDNTQITSNQNTVDAFQISPYLTHFMRGFATAELRYTHDNVSSSNILSTKTDEVRFKLVGDNGGQGWNWDALYDSSKVDDSATAPVTMKSESFTLRDPLTGSVGLFGTIGYENEDYQASNGQAPKGQFWSLGASWNPSVRTSVVASAGKRYFGNTASFDASYRGHNTVWRVSYNEDITTSYAQFLTLSPGDTSALLNQLWLISIPDPAARQQAVNSFIGMAQLLGPNAGITNYISHEFFLQKQLNLSMASSGPRSTLVLNLARIDRTDLTSTNVDIPLLGTSQLALQDHTRQSGIDAAWSWRLSSRSNLNLDASDNRVSSLSTGRTDNNLMLSAGFSRQLRQNVSATIDVHHVRHTSNDGGNYRENGISAALNFRL